MFELDFVVLLPQFTFFLFWLARRVFGVVDSRFLLSLWKITGGAQLKSHFFCRAGGGGGGEEVV